MPTQCVKIRRRLGRASWREVAARARGRELVLVCTVIAADTGEALLEYSTREELLGHLRELGSAVSRVWQPQQQLNHDRRAMSVSRVVSSSLTGSGSAKTDSE